MLLPRSKGKTFTKIQTNHVVIPLIQNVLTFSEVKTFQPSNETSTDNFTADIQEILNNVSDPADTISITELQRKLELIRAQRKQSFTSLSFIIIILLIFFLTTGVAAFVCGIAYVITKQCGNYVHILQPLRPLTQYSRRRLSMRKFRAPPEFDLYEDSDSCYWIVLTATGTHRQTTPPPSDQR